MTKTLNIWVASTQQIKLTAVEEAITLCEQGNDTIQEIRVEGYKASSGVNEQPFGWDEIVQGAEHRLSELKRAKETSNSYVDLYVSIENGIIQLDSHSPHDLPKILYHDTACVIVELAHGYGSIKKSLQFSGSVAVPNSVVQDSMECSPPFSKTAGFFLKKRYPTISEKDPHFSLSRIHRKDLLKAAIQVAYNTAVKEIPV